jgi:predicted DsbA family dithiol-disulfide isomerase
MKPIRIDIYSDYICPFCYIGKGIMDRLGQEFALEAEWLPFELHPKTPLEGIKWGDVYQGMNYENFFNNMTGRGEEAGIRFNPQPLMYNSRLALQAGEHAKEQGRHEAFHDAVFRANFIHGRNIGELGVILELGAGAGMDAAGLEHALRSGRHEARLAQVAELAKAGRIGSAPTFDIQGHGRIIGPKPLEVFRAALRQAGQDRNSPEG